MGALSFDPYRALQQLIEETGYTVSELVFITGLAHDVVVAALEAHNEDV